VKEGREREFKDFGDNQESSDPSSPETFEKSILSWNIAEDNEKQAMFDFYKELIHLRKTHGVLKETDKNNLEVDISDGILILKRWKNDRQLVCYMNYNDEKSSVRVSNSWKGNMQRVLDSSEKNWGGKGTVTSSEITPGDILELPQRSIVIYSN
jgi:maltooligosyltrehalose trehalohydrolase